MGSHAPDKPAFAAPPVSIGAMRRALGKALAAAGLDTPELDARLLVGHAVNLDHAALVSQSDRTLDATERERVDALAARRLAGEPVARILSEKEFWGLTLRLSPATLVPRPETETVVQTALAALDAEGPRTRPLLIADLGTGSGALLLALLSELANARGVGTDSSIDAAAAARANAQRFGLAQRASFAAADFSAALRGPFDLIVSNPPYVRTGDIPLLMREVRDHDPVAALDGGADGLFAYRAIAADAARLLRPKGHLIIEIGREQATPVTMIFGDAGFRVALPSPDLAGIARVLHVKRG